MTAYEATTPVAWKDAEENVLPQKFAPVEPMARKRKIPLAGKFFIGSLLFFVAAMLGAGYIFLQGGNTISPQNITIQVVAPSIVDGGKAASFEVLIENRNQAPLHLVDLIVDYPAGTRNVDDSGQPLTHERQSIGTIDSGQQLKRTAHAVFYGQEGAEQKVTVTLEYTVQGSNAVFQKQAEASFLIGSSPLSVTIYAPSEAISGQEFGIDVVVQSNVTTAIDTVVIQGQYPFGFSVKGTSPLADTGGTLWRLGTMVPGVSKTIHLTGTLDGQDGDQRVFRFLAGSDADPTDTSIKVPLLSVPQTLTIHKPFITASIAIDGQSGKKISVPAGRVITGVITWQNNLSDSVSDTELVLTLSGPAIDKSSVRSQNGFYQSSDNTITWSKEQDESLAQVLPGATGALSFSFATLPPGTANNVYTNPAVGLSVTVVGVRQGQDNVPEKVLSAASTQVLISSALALSAKATHFTGPFSNTGPMPPAAEQKTTYTLSWTVSNSSNTIANASVSAVLPQYVQFIDAEVGSGISYNATSRTVTWNLGDVRAGVGFSLPLRTASFQVSFSPSTSQIGSSPALTGAVTFSGQDRFAQVSVRTGAAPSTILLDPETGFQFGMGAVVQ